MESRLLINIVKQAEAVCLSLLFLFVSQQQSLQGAPNLYVKTKKVHREPMHRKMHDSLFAIQVSTTQRACENRVCIFT